MNYYAIITLIFFSGLIGIGAQTNNSTASGQVFPVDTIQIGLTEAILSGLDHNPNLLVQKVDPQLSQIKLKEQKGIYDPHLVAGWQMGQSQSQRRLGSSANPFDVKDTTTSLNLGLSQALPTGTNVEVLAGIAGSVSNLYTDQYAGNMEFTITQSLLQGFGFASNLATIRKAELDVELSVSELKGVVESVTADIETAYWNLYLSAAEYQIQKQSLLLAKKQLLETQERVNVGKLPDLELAAVSAELAFRGSQLIDAKSKHDQAQLQLNYLIYSAENQAWDRFLKPTDAPAFPEDTLAPVSDHVELGRKYRPDLIQSRLGLQKQDLTLSQTRNGLLPKLDLFISLGRTTYAETFGAATPSISSPFTQLRGGVSFDFPLRNRQSSARFEHARVSRLQMELAVDNMEKLVTLDIRSRYVEVLRTRQQVEATRVTRELQEVKLLAEQEKFRVGKSTNILVLQVQRDFTASQLDEARSVVSYLNALVKLYVSEGTLLERRGITTYDS